MIILFYVANVCKYVHIKKRKKKELCFFYSKGYFDLQYRKNCLSFYISGFGNLLSSIAKSWKHFHRRIRHFSHLRVIPTSFFVSAMSQNTFRTKIPDIRTDCCLSYNKKRTCKDFQVVFLSMKVCSFYKMLWNKCKMLWGKKLIYACASTQMGVFDNKGKCSSCSYTY